MPTTTPFYIGIDPGETTGLVVVTKQAKIFEHTSLKGWKGIDLIIGSKAHTSFLEAVVIEAFRLYPGKAKAQSYSNIPTAEIIGVCKYLCELHGVPVYMQGADKKKHFSDERLKRLGYKVNNIHERDALRHVLYHLQFKERVPILQRLIEEEGYL